MELARRPSAQSRRNAVFGGWEDFLRVYEPLLRRELAQRYPEFTRALRGLERNMCLAYERQNAQVLATLQLKDKRIAALQKKVSKQHEQLDVVLDELERRATTVEIGTQVGNDQQNEPRTVEISVQTDVMEVLKVDTGTQTETTEESEVLVGLEKLEKEMKTLEERNMTLEKELQRHLSKNEAQERTEGAQRRMEERKRVEACLKILQEGVDMMTLSTSCVDNPLALFSGLPTRDGDFGFSTASTCVNLEHRLEAQAIRLEHVQECLYLWREAAVQFMKRPCSDDRIAQAIFPSFSPAPLARGDDKETGLHCSVVLRGVLAQMRQGILGQRTTSSDDNQRVIQEMAKLLAKRKGGTKAAAKVVQKWAGWEARHLEELRALRQSFAAEQAVALSRQTALLKQIDTLEQQQIDLQAEANALRKKKQNGWSDSTLSVISLPDRSVKTSSEADKREEFVTYPQLLVKLGAAEHSLLVKEEQLNTANETINALLAASAPLHKLVDSDSQAGDHMEAINHLVSELQRSSLLKVEFFRRREKGLVNVSKYFQMEKSCLQLQSRLETEQKRTAVLEAAHSVCERERDDLLMKVEKLEMEAMLANLTRKDSARSKPFDLSFKDTMNSDDANDLLYYVLRRQRLLEENCRALRENLRHSQQQVALMTQQHRIGKQQRIVLEEELQTTIFDYVVEHHHECVSTFKRLRDKELSDHVCSDGQLGADQDNDTLKISKNEWEVLLSHYDALWIAFHAVYNFLSDIRRSVQNGKVFGDATASSISILSALGVPVSTEGDVQFKELGVHDFELSRRDEKILLLQRMLMEKEAQLREGRSSTCPRPEDDLPLMNSEGVDKEPCDGQTEDDSPILVSKKPPAPCQDVHAVAKTLDSEIITGSMGDREHVDTKTELEKCLSKCAELTTQNANLSRRLQAEKESSKQQLKDQRELQTQLSATTRENSKLQLSLSQFQVQTTTSAIHQPSLMDEKPLATSAPLDVKVQNAATYSDNTAASKGSHGQASLQEHEALKDQLSSREQENLALVQSLYEIKEKYAQRETTHQKELRAQTAGHAESMETYMATVNETLSRIESGKHRLEEENTNLRLKVQHLEADSARLKVEQSQLSSKGVNTDSSHDLEVLEARIEDLELQLARERKLVEAVERNQQLEIQQDEHHETSAKIEAAKTKEQFDALQEWRTKIEQEFTEYQAVQCAAQQESDRRLAFLSDCVREFVRLTDATSSSGTKSLSTKELYDAVMGIARNPPRDAKRGGLSASQSKVRPKSKASSVRDASAPTWGDEIIEQPIEQSRSPDEQEKSELTWWRLRAAKMESYLHAATQQNETFEDTIERLELRMNDAKEQLSMRLTRETQLVSTLVALKDELATTKEQMVALAEKYQLTSAELERRQGEATIRGDETQRTRIAMQRKTELLAQQKAKVSSLQQELEQASKKAERLVAAEKQTALLQQKAKENTQQLLHIREAYERCRDDNVQLSLHVEKMNERHAAALARLKAARAESTQLRTQLAELKKTANADTMQPGAGGKEIIGLNAVSVASLTEETRALKRRVLQKQEVIASYKAKVAELDAQLERQRETMVKLARTNRELQQVQRQRQIQEHENASFLQAKIETQLQVKQEQLDGLRASVYDSFEAFVYCRGPDTSNQRQHRSPSSSIVDSLNSPWTDDDDSDDKFLAVRRWTDFSPQDLEELQVARGRHQLHERIANKKRDSAKAKRAVLALRDIESALETNPEDCRAEICQLLQCLCN